MRRKNPPRLRLRPLPRSRAEPKSAQASATLPRRRDPPSRRRFLSPAAALGQLLYRGKITEKETAGK